MDVIITKGTREDRIAICRDDGTRADTVFPKKGMLPHDAIHFFVESELGLSNGFWGLVAAGHDPGVLAEMAKAGGHASTSRATIPDAGIIELVQAERLVECFEATAWQGRVDGATFRDIARTACAASHVPMPGMSDAAIARIGARIDALQNSWVPAAAGHVFQFSWHDGGYGG